MGSEVKLNMTLSQYSVCACVMCGFVCVCLSLCLCVPVNVCLSEFDCPLSSGMSNPLV